jgi:Protein of unknown function (DUF3325)
MPEALRLFFALLSSTCGMAWFALAMNVHWQQVRGEAQLLRTRVIALRITGVLAFGVSLWLCLGVDHVSMAALVWVMSLAAAALIVAFMLSWRPRWLAWLSWPGRPMRRSALTRD